MNCYDALLYSSNPLGLQKIYTDYRSDTLTIKDSHGVPQVDLIPDSRFDEIITAGSGKLTMIDQEAFGNDLDPMNVRFGWSTFERMKHAARWFIDFMRRLRTRPGGSGLRIGFGGQPFWDHRWREPGKYKSDISTLSYSRDDHGRFRDLGIMDLVDVIFPCGYCFTQQWETHPAWLANHCVTVAEAFERPVLPWVWGKFHDLLPDVGNTLLPDEWSIALAVEIQPLIDAGTVEALVLWNNEFGTYDKPNWITMLVNA